MGHIVFATESSSQHSTLSRFSCVFYMFHATSESIETWFVPLPHNNSLWVLSFRLQLGSSVFVPTFSSLLGAFITGVCQGLIIVIYMLLYVEGSLWLYNMHVNPKYWSYISNFCRILLITYHTCVINLIIIVS